MLYVGKITSVNKATAQAVITLDASVGQGSGQVTFGYGGSYQEAALLEAMATGKNLVVGTDVTPTATYIAEPFQVGLPPPYATVGTPLT